MKLSPAKAEEVRIVIDSLGDNGMRKILLDVCKIDQLQFHSHDEKNRFFKEVANRIDRKNIPIGVADQYFSSHEDFYTIPLRQQNKTICVPKKDITSVFTDIIKSRSGDKLAHTGAN